MLNGPNSDLIRNGAADQVLIHIGCYSASKVLDILDVY